MGRGGGSRGAKGGGGGGGGAAAPTAPADATTTTGGVATTPLTKEERSALDGYSGAYFREINETLRGNTSVWTDLTPAQLKAETRQIDAAINKGTLTAETTLYRGTSFDALGGGIPAIGTTLSDKGFLSTSRSSSIAEAFVNMGSNKVMLKITAPRGTKGADVSHHVGGHEQEILLGRNTKLRVTGTSTSGGRTIVEVSVVR
jgi:hypothetical protein